MKTESTHDESQHRKAVRRDGRVFIQRIANPCRSVRFRLAPPNSSVSYLSSRVLTPSTSHGRGRVKTRRGVRRRSSLVGRPDDHPFAFRWCVRPGRWERLEGPSESLKSDGKGS